MELSLFLAKLIGLYLIIEGLVLLFRGAMLRRVLGDFMHTPALRYITGVLVLLVGLSMVISHNIWEWSWLGLVTLIGWLILIKSVMYLFMGEKSVAKLYKSFDKKGYYVTAGVIALVLGIYLAKIGFGI
ncbi:MAG: hypothetical protein HZA95_00850 [Candidatus Vogelbacteria bacterium]|nr:hypothetical protein [Candidatus Vogelbacteria bacterium]